MIYKCENKNCKMYGIEVRTGIHYTYKEGIRIDNNLKCPECGQNRSFEEVDKGLSTNVLGRKNVPKN